MAGARRPRVVVLHPSDELYGADKVLLEVVEVLRDQGPLEVWLPDDVDYGDGPLSRQLAASGVRVRRLPLPVLRRAYLRPRALPALVGRWIRTARLLRAARPDLVYLNTSAVLSVAPAARSVGARVVLHLHESWRGSDRLLLGALLPFCDRVVAVSAATLAALPRHRVRTTVVPNGFPDPQVSPERRDRLRASISLLPDDVAVVMASRWNTWKGHDVLIDAWGRVARRDVRLVLLGGPPAVGASFDVLSAVEACPRADSVTVVGETDDATGWISAADVVVVPSTRPDPLPTIAIEALGGGRAVLASDSGGLPEIVTDGVTGRLLPTGDPAAWAAELESVDPAQLRRWGRAGREAYESTYTQQAFRTRLASVIADVDRADRQEGKIR